MKILTALLLAAGLISAFAPRAGAADGPAERFTALKREDGTVVFTVRSSAVFSKEAAVGEALLYAQPLIADYLRGLDNPIAYVPPIEFLRAKMMKPPAFDEIKPTGNESSIPELGSVYVATLKLEMPPSMEQQFRQAARVTSGLWGLGCAMAALIVVGAFFRLDEWTKGFLTTWLVVGAAGAIAGLGVFWFLVQ